MLKITKRDCSKEEWALVEADFGSLQMRLAMQDEALNRSGVDKICYDLYGPTGHNDAHSQTAFNIFCEALNREIIELDDGTIFAPDQYIIVDRGGQEQEILGEDYKETDTFVRYA